MLLKLRDAFFERVDLGNGALQRKAERIHGAFEAFEKIHLHHRDEDLLATFLSEAAENLALVGGLRLGGQIAAQKTGGMVKGQTEGTDLLVEFLEGEETVLEIDGSVEGLGRRTLGETAEAGHFLGVVAGDLAAGASDAEAVEQFEKIAADRSDEITGLAQAGRARGVGPTGEMSLGEPGRLFDGGNVEVLGEG